MGVSTIGGGGFGSVTGRGGGIRSPTPKHTSPIYRDPSNIGAITGGEAETGSTGGQ